MAPQEKLLKQIENAINAAILDGKFQNRKAVIFGCNSNAAFIKEILLKSDICVLAVLDNDRTKQGKKILGLEITAPDSFIKNNQDIVIVICSAYENEMISQLCYLGVNTENQVINIPMQVMEFNGVDSIRDDQKRIEDGYKLYRDIVGDDGSKMLLLFPYHGTGDVYVACCFLNQYLKKQHINNYVLVVNGKSCQRVAALFGYQDIYCIDDKKSRNLLDAWIFLGQNIVNLKPLIHWGWRGKNTPYVFDNEQMSFVDMYRYDVFGLDESVVPQHPRISVDLETEKTKLKSLGLQPEKTVIIAPYANSMKTGMSLKLWEKIAEGLTNLGYSVATNCFGKEEPIFGTIPISFDYAELIRLLDAAGGFVSLRSGLCDIVSQANCKMVIFYENNVRSTSFNHFGLSKMKFNLREIPIFYENENDIKYVFDAFRNQ